MIEALCQRWRIPDYSDYLYGRYWPAFSRLEDEGQRAFWDVLGVQEVSDVFSKDQGGQNMPPHIAIVVRGGVVEEGDPPNEWRPPDVVITDQERFEAYTSGKYTP